MVHLLLMHRVQALLMLLIICMPELCAPVLSDQCAEQTRQQLAASDIRHITVQASSLQA
jgi:hypothetical protein